MVDGTNSYDLRVSDSVFFDMVVKDGMRGLGDAYMQSVWDCDDLVEFFCRAIRAGLLEQMAEAGPMKVLVNRFTKSNPQSVPLAVENVAAHYDRHDELVRLSVDLDACAYTCARWVNPLGFDDEDTLMEAQRRKFDLICRKLHFRPGMRIADLGCGYGGFMAHAVENYGVRAVGYNVSKAQCALIRDRYGDQRNLEVVQTDWRNLEGEFDRIVSIGMGEHVGRNNFGKGGYMELVSNHLKDGGLAFTHFFGKPHENIPLIDTWSEAHIFPGIDMLTLSQIAGAADGFLSIVDVEEIGQHYPKTLWHWARNFERHKDRVLADYGEETYRMWWYYLNTAISAFVTRRLHLWQIVYTKRDCEQLYVPAR